VAKRDEYTTDIDALEDRDEFDEFDGDEESLADDDLEHDLSADLEEADLEEADLEEADLEEADLEEADLEEADLDDVDLGADLGAALTEDLEVSHDLDDEEVTARGTTHVEDEDDEEALDDEDEEEGEEELDVLLGTRPPSLDDDVPYDEPRDGLGNSDAPIGAGEFTCHSCFLVKRRPQLADQERMICYDCL
jgi:hypothetical protein